MSEGLPSQITALLKERAKDVIADWELKPAAVLVPLFLKDGEYHLLFTKRTDHLRHHPGQISFPGGRRDPSDTDLLETALREAEEEIGLKREQVVILGELDDMMTVTQYRITPFVGIIPYPYEFQVNLSEIERLIEVPLKVLLDPAKLEIQYRAFFKDSIAVYYYHVGPEPIWGATARIVKNFLEAIYPALQVE